MAGSSAESRCTISFSVMSRHSSIRFWRRGASSNLGPCNPSDRARYADPEPCPSLPGRHAFEGLQYSRPKIPARYLPISTAVKVIADLL